MAILGVTGNRSKTISDTRVSVSWELLQYRLFPKWQFLAENVLSASGCSKVNGSRWKKEKKKIQLDHASATDPRSSRASLPQHRRFGRGLYDHCSITHWKWRDSRKNGFQPASSPSLLPPASPHLPLPTGFSTVFSDFCGSTQHCLGTHTMPVKSRESCKCTWICSIFFSDSLWIGRSHFNQGGEHLHSSLWKVFF